MIRHFLLVLACVAMLSNPASAQLGLPSLPLPRPGEVIPDPTSRLERTLDVRALRHARLDAVTRLLRANRDVLDADPDGEPIVRAQVIAIAPSEAALAAALEVGFRIESRDQLDGVGVGIVVLRAPPRMSTRRALRALRRADPEGVYDYDHLHLGSGAQGRGGGALAQRASDGGGPRVGLIDGGVGAHPALAHGVAAQRCFVGETPIVSAHATAVASLLAGDAPPFRGAAPGARLYVADVFGGAPVGGSTSAIARALSWLAGEDVAVINISLVGPRNAVLEALIARLVARGFVIVASVGNDGPAARPLYPAAYAGVVGVTGVDVRDRVLLEAGRGPQVDFAAPGAGIEAAHEAAYGPVRGTSYATPIVAGLIAAELDAPDVRAASAALQRIAAGARDLGARGRDEVFGAGLIGVQVRR